MKKANDIVVSKQKVSSAEIQTQLARKFRVKSVISKRKEIDCKGPSNGSFNKGKISQQEWEFIEYRAIQQSTQSCAICFNYFRNDYDQVILNCGHVFHGTCFSAFERYSGTDHSFCAICRNSSYSIKSTNVGFISRKSHAVISIQSCIRGFIERQRVRERLRVYFQSKPRTFTSSRKTEFYSKELTNISTRFLRHVDSNQSQIDTLISTMERSLEVSKSLDKLCDTFEVQKTKTDIPWDLILKTTLQRNEIIECTICMCAIKREKIVVLSCTHAFHLTCFTSLEYFCSIQGGAAQRQCPVCRSSIFQKMNWFVK
jgi:hypothetical protein